MSNHMELACNEERPTPVIATGTAIGMAVAVAGDELVTTKSGLFGRWGKRVVRYPLSELTKVKVIPNPSTNLVQLEFAGTPPRSVVLMFGPGASRDFERVASALRACLEER